MPVQNLGIANVVVQLYSDSAPNLAKSVKKYNFDISAYNRDIIENSPFAKPLLAEYIEDPNGTFSAFYPSKRKVYKDNRMADSTTTSVTGTISWTPIMTPPTGLPLDIFNVGVFDAYSVTPPITGSVTPPSGYLGPTWETEEIEMAPQPNDAATIKGYMDWYSSLASGSSTPSVPPSPSTAGPVTVGPSTSAIHQTKNHDGLWWAVQSNDFLEENVPFWVNFKKMDAPSSATHDTCFVIRIGPDDTENKFDIYLSLNNRPRIVDYITSTGSTSGGGTGVPPIQVEFANDLARTVHQKSGDNDMEVGIMTVAGRLCVIVNNIPLVYARVSRETGDDGGKLMECKIPSGKIQIFGTNAEVRINVCPMAFAETSIISLPLPTIIDDSSGGGSSPIVINYMGCDYKGDESGSVAELPKPPSMLVDLFGVDCENFSGDGGSCSPSGFGFHENGEILFKRASASTYAALPSTDFYTLQMTPSSTTMFAGETVKNGGCPYFFRLKGLKKFVVTGGASATDVSDYLISVDETAQAPDYFHVKKNASLTFYNENNIVGDIVITNQTAIDISWNWTAAGGLPLKTFTGIVVSMSKSEIAGKETITLNCEDYIYALNKIPIINSPFYDGMVASFAIKDLAERGGILSFLKDWEPSEEEYFLPSGYSFSQPKMRFSSTQSLMDCILEIVKRFEAYIYFDGDGVCHINKLEGGLLSAPPAGGPTASFTSDMIIGGAFNTILEERNVEISFDSTVNYISVLTLDRDTRNAIIYGLPSPDDKLIFLKPTLINQPAYGEIEVTRAYAEDLGKRLFYPILKTRFKTTGASTIVMPLDFIKVDTDMFRTMSVKRSFNADSNDMNCSYECEWLGGGI